MQAYSEPKRASDPHSLPDVEVFHSKFGEYGSTMETGWYWHSCFPGCLPDSDPIGPFATAELALADAQVDADEFEDDTQQTDGECMYCGKSIWLDADGWRHDSPGTMPICNHIPEPKA